MIKVIRLKIDCEIELNGVEDLDQFRQTTAAKFNTHPDNIFITHEDYSEKHNPAISRGIRIINH